MKLNRTEKGKKQAKASISKVGTMLGTGALAVLAIGTISVFALTGTSVKSMDVAKADSITTTSQTDAQQTSVSKVEWRKAGISEYELAQTETAATTKKVDTTTQAAKTETTAEKKAAETTTAAQVTQQETTTTKAVTTQAATKAPVATTKAPAQTTTAAQTTQSKDTVISYTNEEFDMFCYVVQGEVGNCTENYKIAVANVIINRVKSDEFPDTIKGVLTANNQFTAINGYYNGTTPPNQNTIDCVNRALRGEDNSNGATFYYSPDFCSGSTAAWFESLNFCLEFENARFFKNW